MSQYKGVPYHLNVEKQNFLHNNECLISFDRQFFFRFNYTFLK